MKSNGLSNAAERMRKFKIGYQLEARFISINRYWIFAPKKRGGGVYQYITSACR